jgi:hypothetical protein
MQTIVCNPGARLDEAPDCLSSVGIATIPAGKASLVRLHLNRAENGLLRGHRRAGAHLQLAVFGGATGRYAVTLARAIAKGHR